MGACCAVGVLDVLPEDELEEDEADAGALLDGVEGDVELCFSSLHPLSTSVARTRVQSTPALVMCRKPLGDNRCYKKL